MTAAHLLPDAALDRQADIAKIAHDPLRQPTQTVLALAQTRIKKKDFSPIGWHRPRA